MDLRDICHICHLLESRAIVRLRTSNFPDKITEYLADIIRKYNNVYRAAIKLELGRIRKLVNVQLQTKPITCDVISRGVT